MMANESWTAEEIQKYKQIRRKELGPVYLSAGIPITDPAGREEYLVKQFNLGFSERVVTHVTSKMEGKAEALRRLEDRAVREFF